MALKSTGYQTTLQSIAWTSGQALNSAADSEWTDLSDEIDNTSNLYVMADVEIVLASAAFTGVDSGIGVYIIPSADGTNYPNWTGNVATDEQENTQYFVGFGTTSGSTAAQRIVVRDVALPAGKYKFAFRNQGGVALAASGNSAGWRPHSYQDV